MTTTEVNKAAKVLKETAKEITLKMMNIGANSQMIFKVLSSKFNMEFARMIMVDIALDLGMEKEAKQYLAQF